MEYNTTEMILIKALCCHGIQTFTVSLQHYYLQYHNIDDEYW